jgi:S1-C subfamily serine protease
MTRRTLLFAVLGLCLSPLAANAEPYFGFRFAQTREGIVEVSYVDASGLARQMGLKKGDVLKKINDKVIRTNEDVFAALKTLRGRYTIEIDREMQGDSQSKTLTGEIRESTRTPGKFYHVPIR